MQTWVIFLASVLALGMFSQWISWKLRIPSILPLLIIGFGAGQFFGDAVVMNENVLFAIVSLSVATIMLEGGLTLKFDELKTSGKPLFQLITIGAAITWALSTVALYYIVGFGWKISLLLGAILVVTGPTVIGPLLRNVRPHRNLNSILKWEGIVIDPIGAVLAVLVFSVAIGHDENHHGGALDVAKQIALTLIVGFGFGWVVGKMILFALRRHWIPDYLQSLIVLTIGLLLFAISNSIQHESGLLTVTILGIVIVNQHNTPVRHIVEFKEHLRVLLISFLFIVLGGRVSLAEISGVWKEALLLVVALILVIRPVSVFVSTIGSGLTIKEKAFLAFLAPRGIVAAAVSAIFALELTHQGGELGAQAEKIVPVVFCIILGTVGFYGLSAAWIAKKLKVATPNPQGILFAGARKWVIEMGLELKEAGYQITIIDANYNRTRNARMKGLNVVTANVNSDYAIEHIELAGIGKFIAATPNSEVNSLSCLGFAHVLGRSNVYQLDPDKIDGASDSARKAASMELSGRLLFGKGNTARKIERFFNDGGKVRSTLLTDDFDFEKFSEVNQDSAIPMFVIRKNGDLTVITETSREPGAGDTLVSLGKDIEESANPKSRETT